MKRALAFTGLALSVGACAPQTGGSLNLSKDASGIIGGVDAKGDEPFAKITTALYNTRMGSLCTASILSDSVLMTAAHCVDGGVPTDLVAVFNLDLHGEDLVVRRVKDAKTSDEWDHNQDNELETGDIALVQFVGGLPEGFHPAKMLEDASALKEGGDVLLAGYGISDGVNHTGAGILRSVTTKIKNPAYSKTEVLLDQTQGHGACHGDSGGPAYVSVGGELMLFGVTSRGVDDPNNDCSKFSAYTNALAYKDWIKRTMDAFAGKKETPIARRPRRGRASIEAA